MCAALAKKLKSLEDTSLNQLLCDANATCDAQSDSEAALAAILADDGSAPSQSTANGAPASATGASASAGSSGNGSVPLGLSRDGDTSVNAVNGGQPMAAGGGGMGGGMGMGGGGSGSEGGGMGGGMVKSMAH